MDLDLNGRIAVVTGAGRGIGLATTKALVDEGAIVVAGSRTIASLEDRDVAVLLDRAPDQACRPATARVTTPGEVATLIVLLAIATWRRRAHVRGCA